MVEMDDTKVCCLLYQQFNLEFPPPCLCLCVFARVSFRPTGWMWMFQTATVWQLWCLLSGTSTCLKTWEHICHGSTNPWRSSRNCWEFLRKKAQIHAHIYAVDLSIKYVKFTRSAKKCTEICFICLLTSSVIWWYETIKAALLSTMLLIPTAFWQKTSSMCWWRR